MGSGWGLGTTLEVFGACARALGVLGVGLGTFKLLGAGLYSFGVSPIFGIWCKSNSRVYIYISLQFANLIAHFHLS